MKTSQASQEPTGPAHADHEADVLVVGGGPAGTWAALSAARRGGRVTLVDKAYCGTSGAAAASNNTVWYVPDAAQHGQHFDERHASGGGLNERAWVDAVLQSTAEQLHLFAELGYPFARTLEGGLNYASLRGPDYLRTMRHLLGRAGVTILDHSPMSTLLTAPDGRVAGARGTSRDGAAWQVRAGATVVATGGCAFLSGALGTNVCTGDGHLAAAEAGVSFSGMEFSNQYGLALASSSVTKGLPFHWASYYRADGREIEVGDEEPFVAVARVQQHEPVLACFDRANADIERWLRSAQTNAFLPYDRMGIDPFRQRFPLGLRLEGTVRGTGGIEMLSRDGATCVPGLFVAGDAASREPIVGGRSGGGSPNAAWAIASGRWAGEGASRFAQARGIPPVHEVAPAAPTARVADPQATRELIQRLVWPVGINLFRNAATLTSAVGALDDAWRAPPPAGVPEVAGRQARAMLLMGRLGYRSALARRESRALHQRLDHPDRLPGPPQRLRARGLDDIGIQPVAVPASDSGRVSS